MNLKFLAVERPAYLVKEEKRFDCCVNYTFISIVKIKFLTFSQKQNHPILLRCKLKIANLFFI